MSQPYTTDSEPIVIESPVSESVSAADEIFIESPLPSHASSGVGEPLMKKKLHFSKFHGLALTGMTMMIGMILVTQVSAGTKAWLKSQSFSNKPAAEVVSTPVPTLTPTPMASHTPSATTMSANSRSLKSR